MQHCMGLHDDLQKQLDSFIKNRNIFNMIDQLSKRVVKGENCVIELRQENEQLRAQKNRQIELIDQEVKGLHDTLNNKVWLKLLSNEKE